MTPIRFPFLNKTSYSLLPIIRIYILYHYITTEFISLKKIQVYLLVKKLFTKGDYATAFLFNFVDYIFDFDVQVRSWNDFCD